MGSNKINIRFDAYSLGNPAVSSVIKKCVEATLLAENIHTACEVNVLVTDDDTIRDINNRTRGIDKATDVLSFPMFSFTPGVPPQDWQDYIDPETGLCPLGDMAISLERARSQAKEFGHSARREVGYLTIHSILHLLGYDHLDEGPEKARMRAREDAIAASIPRMSRD